MSENYSRPTAPGPGGTVPRFGMYAGPNYAGGHALRPGELPDAPVWRVPPVGYLDDITRNHDINYTYIEQTYRAGDAASREAKTQAFWQADKEMLGAMLRYQPNNWLEAQYRQAAIQAFVAKADLNYRPTVDVVGDWNRELADLDPKFPAMRVNEEGRPAWSLPGLLHAGATYTGTGMEALSTSGVNSQVAGLFNLHIKPGHIEAQRVNTGGEQDDPLAERDFSRRLLIPQRDSSDVNVFTAEGNIHGKHVSVWYDQGKNLLIRTVSSNGQIESQTTYIGTPAPPPAGERYGHADFTVTQQKYANGQPVGEPVVLPPVKADALPDTRQQESPHTTQIKETVQQGKEAVYPKAPTEADKAWQSGRSSAHAAAPVADSTPPQAPAKVVPANEAPEQTPTGAPTAEEAKASLSPAALRLLADSARLVHGLADKHHLPWGPGMDNTVAAVARDAHARGLSRIDLMASRDGQVIYAQKESWIIQEGEIGAKEAANRPEAESLTAMVKVQERAQAPAAHHEEIQLTMAPARGR